MRKLFALAMVVVLSTTLAFALVSCGKKAEEASTPPPAESTPSTMSSDSGMSQPGGMAAPAESTMKK
jgi:hypothetical protein